MPPSWPQRALFKAAAFGYYWRAKFLLWTGVDVNCEDGGATPIRCASIGGHLDVVDILIRAGADIECKDNDGNTPIIIASIKGHREVVDLLIKAGANIEHVNNQGRTPLGCVSIEGHEEVVDLLIKAGADIECKDSMGNTPISCASYKGHREVVDLLIKAGADIECKDSMGNTPISCASYKGHREVVDLLIRAGADIECKDNTGNTPIIIASIKEHREVVDLLIKAGANIEHVNNQGRTPLGCVSIEGHKEVVDLLIKAGANVECKDMDGNTPMSSASIKGHREVVDLLIKAGADIEHVNNRGRTPLGCVSIEGHEEAVDLLIKAGADIECKDMDGNTPISSASIQGHREVVDLLIKAGADIECNNNGDTPISSASIQGHREVVDLLIKAGADIECKDNDWDTPISCASYKGHREVVDLLIKAGADIECKDNDWDTPIITASIDGQREVVDQLITAGANIECCNQKNKSPIVCAAEEGNVQVVELLLGKGACSESASYGSILNIAATFGQRRVAEFLLKRGISLESRDLIGNTPLQNATVKGHLSVVKLLIDSGANASTLNALSESIIFSAASSGHADIVKYLGRRDTRVLLDLPNASGWSPISKAVSDGHFQTVRQLHSLGADLNCMADGKGLLHLAAESGGLDIYQYLIIAGLDCKRPNSHGLKSYECFVFRSKVEYSACNRLGHKTEQSLYEAMSRLDDQNITYKFKYKQSALSDEPGLGKVECIEGNVSETVMKFVREKEIVRGLELCGSSAEGTKVQLPDEMDFLRLLHADHLSRNEIVDTLHGYKHMQGRKIKKRFLSSKAMHVFESQSVESKAKAKESKKSGEISSHAVAGGGSASVPVTIRWHEPPSLRVSEDEVAAILVDDWPDGWPDDALRKVESEFEVYDDVMAEVCVYRRTRDIFSEEFDGAINARGTSATCRKHKHKPQIILTVDIPPTFHPDVSASDWPENLLSYLSKHLSDAESQKVESESEVIADVCVYQRTGGIFTQEVARRGWASVPVTIERHERQSSSLLVSVDIVPILHVDDWPDDAIKKTWLMDEETLRKSGYRLVAKPPHKDSEYGRSLPEEDRERMWRISFSHLEPKTIAPLDPRVKDAYITAKCLRSPLACGIVIKDKDGVIHFVSHFLTSYLLKTVFLYNIDDFLARNRSLPEMVFIIYSQLEDYLGKGNLPLYWQPSVNLLEGLKLNIAKSHQVAKLMKAIAGRMYRLECDGGNHGDDAREDGTENDAAADEPDIGCYIVRLE